MILDIVLASVMAINVAIWVSSMVFIARNVAERCNRFLIETLTEKMFSRKAMFWSGLALVASVLTAYYFGMKYTMLALAFCNLIHYSTLYWAYRVNARWIATH